jgi:hypothetical protein
LTHLFFIEQCTERKRTKVQVQVHQEVLLYSSVTSWSSNLDTMID